MLITFYVFLGILVAGGGWTLYNFTRQDFDSLEAVFWSGLVLLLGGLGVFVTGLMLFFRYMLNG